MTSHDKPLVVLLGRADWSGSGHAVCEAVNQAGGIECRQISLYPHVFDYPSDIVIPLCYVPNPGKAGDYPREFEEAMELFGRAALIHLWNDLPQAFHGLLKVPQDKIRSCTFSGTDYRLHHAVINGHLRERRIRLVVENPTYRFPDELDAEFIPHAVDTVRLAPLPAGDREPGSIGCYQPEHHHTTAHADIARLKQLLARAHPDWHVALDRRMAWTERMSHLRRCRFFFEYMDSAMGYWGRSALEACAMGVPAFSLFSEKALAMAQGRIGQPAIIPVRPENLESILDRYLNLAPEPYNALCLQSRRWVERYFRAATVGALYSRFFLGVLEELSGS